MNIGGTLINMGKDEEALLHLQKGLFTLSSRSVGRAPLVPRESVLFIGTRFSNLYTAVDTPAKGRVGVGPDFCTDLGVVYACMGELDNALAQHQRR